MRVGDLVEIRDDQDGNKGKLGVVSYIISNTEVQIECSDGPWIYYNNQLEVKGESKTLK